MSSCGTIQTLWIREANVYGSLHTIAVGLLMETTPLPWLCGQPASQACHMNHRSLSCSSETRVDWSLLFFLFFKQAKCSQGRNNLGGWVRCCMVIVFFWLRSLKAHCNRKSLFLSANWNNDDDQKSSITLPNLQYIHIIHTVRLPVYKAVFPWLHPLKFEWTNYIISAARAALHIKASPLHRVRSGSFSWVK